MHSLVRRYIKTAVLFLMVGLTIGAWMIARREGFGRHPNPYEETAHTHSILVGFVMMMILGVALWLFPRPAKEDERYSPARAELAYWLITLGTAARIAGELLRASSDAAWLRWTIVAAGIAQVAAVAVFFHAMWGRIRGVGSPAREARGERF